MSIGTEFIISLIVQLLILAFFVGIYVSTIRNIEKQVEEMKDALKQDKEEMKETLRQDKQELKEDMRRYNSVLERMAINEQSVKSAHHRIDRLEEEK